MEKNIKHKLSNEVELPLIGFGTADLEGNIEELVKTAIRAGFRLVDTAMVYGSERFIGKALQKLLVNGEIKREDLFIQTKLDPSCHGYLEAKNCFQHSLDNLQLDYVDAYLIHWPVPRGNEENYKEKNIDTWRAFEEFYKQGKAKSIGVCNFLERHLLHILENCEIKPMINQLEIHPTFQQKGLVGFCRERNILIEAWSPMGRGGGYEKYDNIAKKYSKNIGQILLRWSVQKGFIPLSRSSKQERIQGNIDIFDFEISEEDMLILDSFNTNNDFLDIWSYKRQQMY